MNRTLESSTSDEEDNNLFLGILLGLLGSVAINTGNNIQALGLHQLEEQREQHVEEANTKSTLLNRKGLKIAESTQLNV